jgi:hypothetical protein
VGRADVIREKLASLGKKDSTTAVAVVEEESKDVFNKASSMFKAASGAISADSIGAVIKQGDVLTVSVDDSQEIVKLCDELTEFIGDDQKYLNKYVTALQKKYNKTLANSYMHLVSDKFDVPGYTWQETSEFSFLSSTEHLIDKNEVVLILKELREGGDDINLIKYENIGTTTVVSMRCNDYALGLFSSAGFDCGIEVVNDSLILKKTAPTF